MLDRIKIGWKEYRVSVVEPDHSLILDGKECCGTINFDSSTIHLNGLMSNEENKNTLIHEILHGIEDMYGIELGEDKVDRLGNALFTILKDNNLEITQKSR